MGELGLESRPPDPVVHRGGLPAQPLGASGKTSLLQLLPACFLRHQAGGPHGAHESDFRPFCPQVRSPTDMGRRKSKRKPPPKKKMTGTLETQFTCPFCNHEKSCDVKM